MYLFVNLTQNFFVNFSMNFSGREETGGEESCRREKTGGKFLAGYFIWRERDLFLGGIIFLAGRWTDPVSFKDIDKYNAELGICS